MLPPQEKMTEANSGCLNIYENTVMSHSFLITAAGPMIFPSTVIYFLRGGLFE